MSEVVYDVSVPFAAGTAGYCCIQSDFANGNWVPRAPAGCAADLVAPAIGESSLARPTACDDDLWTQKEKMSNGKKEIFLSIQRE